jgi:hypothetical protein
MTQRNRLQSTGAAPIIFLISGIAFTEGRLSDKFGVAQDRMAAVCVMMLDHLTLGTVRQFVFSYQS